MFGASKYSRQRRNHVRLVVQNILAGQELLSVAMTIPEEHEELGNLFPEIRSHIGYSRALAKGLFEKGSVLAPDLLEHQARLNKSYRKLFEFAQRSFPSVYSHGFDEFFEPPSGWQAFDQAFQQDALRALTSTDPFWENDK